MGTKVSEVEWIVEQPASAPVRLPFRLPRSRLLFAWDVVVTAAAFSFTSRIDALHPGAGETRSEAAAALPGMLSWPALVFLVASLVGLAMVRGRESGLGGHASALVRLGAIAAVAGWTTLTAGLLAGFEAEAAQLIAVSLALPIAWTMGRVAIDRPRRERVLLIGSGRVATHLTVLVSRHPECRFDIVGTLDDDPPAADGERRAPLLGSIDDLPLVLAGGQIDRIIVCFSAVGDERIADALRQSDAHDVRVDVVPRMFDLAAGGRCASRHADGEADDLADVARPGIGDADRLDEQHTVPGLTERGDLAPGLRVVEARRHVREPEDGRRPGRHAPSRTRSSPECSRPRAAASRKASVPYAA
ncbi:nucleoside-diphosphate sugar epimerase/dehydratase [Miltoncostaea marina]|uniref:nucleoside-diphosphate sugar epimerase/dehydratase n=1 Tax=Miltoncostaea marina TaxID=2843215 RepID=UPI001C3D458F|nr:hypothetical protein [Miltoncostaea marina]